MWEPGCGSGQATRGLAAHFAHVHATEPSAQQLAQHWARPESSNVTLAVEPGERTALPDASVQLVAVAQALHWFDRQAFFAECERVLEPGGVLAAWGYADFVAPEGMVDAVADFRAQIDPYWPPERALVDARYAGFALAVSSAAGARVVARGGMDAAAFPEVPRQHVGRGALPDRYRRGSGRAARTGAGGRLG